MATFPLSIGTISNVTITEFTPQYFTESLSYKQRTRDRGIHQLQGEFTFTVTGTSNKKALRAFLLQTKGRGVPIQMSFPGDMFTNTSVTGTPLTTSSISVGATTISIDTFGGTISAGDFFKVLNDTKVYTVLDGETGPSGSIDIYPPLRVQLQDNSPLTFTNISMDIYLTSDSQTVTHTESGEIHEIQFSWKEVV